MRSFDLEFADEFKFVKGEHVFLRSSTHVLRTANHSSKATSLYLGINIK